MKVRHIGWSCIPALVISMVGCAAPSDDEDGEGTELETVQGAATSGCRELAPAAISANGNDGNLPSNVDDDDLGTRWSQAGKGAWIQFDLGSVKNLCNVQIGWHQGERRTNAFVVTASNDGKSFSRVRSGTSSGTTKQLETYSFAGRSGRYVRVTVNGNSVNDWASITELKVFGGDVAAPPPPTGPGTLVPVANLQAALDNAKGGETFRVGPGSIKGLFVKRTFSPAVSIVAADPKKLPDLGYVRIEDTSGVSVSGVRMSAVKGYRVVNVSFVGNDIYGNPSAPPGACIDIRYENRDVRIVDNKCRNADVGIIAFDHTGYTMEDNDVDAIVSDSYKVGGLKGFSVARNIGARTINRLADSHPDFMQVQGPLVDGKIVENISLPASQPWTQGIFGGDPKAVLENVTIADNILMGAHIRQISVRAGARVVIEHNTLLDVPDTGPGDSRIFVVGNATVRKNIFFGNVGSVGENLILTTEKPGTPLNHEKIFTKLELGMNAKKLALLPGAPKGYGARITCPW